jgi:hypothetical protein
MVRLSIAVAAIVFLGCGSLALAQDNPAPRHAHKAHAKKVESSSSSSNDASEDWSIALPKSSGDKATDVSTDPNVAAGRKKFFEQSTTVEGGGPDGAHTGSSSSGFTPSMGLNF